jgi:hypothetical protein
LSFHGRKYIAIYIIKPEKKREFTFPAKFRLAPQFWPRAEGAAKQRLPAAVVTKSSKLFFTIADTPVAMCMSAHINRLGSRRGTPNTSCR